MLQRLDLGQIVGRRPLGGQRRGERLEVGHDHEVFLDGDRIDGHDGRLTVQLGDDVAPASSRRNASRTGVGLTLKRLAMSR